MKIIVVIFSVSVFYATTVAPAQTIFTPISNLGQTNDNGVGLNQNGAAAVSFTTGNATASLLSISVSLGGFNGFESPGSFNLSLHNDSASPPGNTLANLSGDSYPTSGGIYTYTNASPLILSANTTYWIVASSDSFYEGAYAWNGTTTTNLDSGAFWTLGSSLIQNIPSMPDGYNWAANSGDYLLFSVNVTNLSAISISGPPLSISQPVAFQPIVLTYSATNLLAALQQNSVVLQQNPDLDTTNWTAVSNVVFSGTNTDNQVFFVLPATAPQMFYRLNFQ